MKKISIASLLIIVIVILTTFINYLIYNNYYNTKIIDIVNQIVEENEEIETKEIANILKNPQEVEGNVLEKYGYNESDLYLVGDIKERICVNICINVCITTFILIIVNLIYSRKKKNNLNQINNLLSVLEKINKGNYDIDLNTYTESDFSKLRNEIYNTTVVLKEYSEFLENDRMALKNNLADISHQIRTPLTSIILMLENIVEDKEMPEYKKDEFINIIYKQSEKIKYLIEVLLKLSKFDTSVINFKKEEVLVSDLLNNSILALEYLVKDKNININMVVDKKTKIRCDSKWQEEAITNIVKNCIEFSKENGTIDIKVDGNNFYTTIIIKDYGVGIKKEELKNIFIRFHKDKSSSGFGIGLNLAKTIIEKDNGILDVKSKENEYTKFTIKYIK